MMTRTRTIAVLTTGRQDWGSLRSVCMALRDTPRIRLDLIVGGMHLSPRYGRTVDVIEADGFRPDVELAWLPAQEDPPGDAQAAAAAAAVGAHLRAVRPHGLLVMGDRMETAAAALAATIDRVPIAHLHGGEQTFGAFDDVLRHAYD
jgi:UDP-N-acetylglucosamine 2-epimerase